MLPEFIKVAENVLSGEDPDALSASILGREKGATNKRQFYEIRRRIKSLTPSQIEVLSEGTFDDQKHITHLALCKTYGLYRDFVAEVLLEKIMVFDYQLSELDYNSFISKKKMNHPELEALAETTEKKVRQVIYRMLQQVGIIDSVSNPSIFIPNLSLKVKEVIVNDDPKWLNYFFQNN